VISGDGIQLHPIVLLPDYGVMQLSPLAPFCLLQEQYMCQALLDRADICLGQASATYGTRAKLSTWNDFQWHAE